jgi:hypothetical protein
MKLKKIKFWHLAAVVALARAPELIAILWLLFA